LLVAPFVASARPLDLLLCAKHLFITASWAEGGSRIPPRR